MLLVSMKDDLMQAEENNKRWCKMITSLTKHIPNVSILGQRSKFILSPSVTFIVVPGELHHLQTQNKHVKMWDISSLIKCASNNTFSVQILAFKQKQDNRMQKYPKPSGTDVRGSTTSNNEDESEEYGFNTLATIPLVLWSMDKCSRGLEKLQEEIWGCFRWQGKTTKNLIMFHKLYSFLLEATHCHN